MAAHRLCAAGLALYGGFALAACHKEPTFDERFDTAKTDIEKTAKGIDAELSPVPADDTDTPNVSGPERPR